MKCPLCNTEAEYNETHSEHYKNEGFPFFCMDWWCEKGHLIQAIANEDSIGFQVIVIAEDSGGDELFGFWYTPSLELKEITDWATGAQVWSQ